MYINSKQLFKIGIHQYRYMMLTEAQDGGELTLGGTNPASGTIPLCLSDRDQHADSGSFL